jgi:hypothetical protein
VGDRWSPALDVDDLQADVRRAVSRSLELWWRFFDGIATAVDAC